MVAEWVKGLAVWYHPWPGHVLVWGVGLNPTGDMAGLCTLVKPLINCIVVRINKTFLHFFMYFF